VQVSWEKAATATLKLSEPSVAWFVQAVKEGRRKTRERQNARCMASVPVVRKEGIRRKA
jgi:hypothetical protein